MDTDSLKKKVVRGGVFSITSQGVGIIVQLLSTIILARLLTPADYGTISMVLAITAFAGLFRDMGLSSAAIQKKDLTYAQQSNLFWLNVAMGLFLTLAIALSSPLIASFYDKPELLWVAVVISSSLFIGSLGAQHGAMLLRGMQFGKNAVANVAGALLNMAVSVWLAYEGLSYWALVYGIIAGTGCTTVLLLVFSPFKPKWFSKNSGTRELFSFGANVTASNFVNYFSRNLDNILIGRFWGAEVLGAYNRAYQLLMFPIINLRGPVSSVMFPALSRLDPLSKKFRNYYHKSMTLLALATMPLMTWLFFASNDLIQVVLGHNWSEVTPLFKALAIAGFIQPVSSMRGVIMLAAGNSKRNLLSGIVTSIVIALAFVVGISWGALGVAYAYSLAVWLLAMPMHSYAIRGTSIRTLDLVSVSFVPLLCSFTAGCLSYFLTGTMIGLPPIARLIVLALIFLLITAFITLLYPNSRRILTEIWSELKN
ncbi:lipopolysaccharide biosynthesis protein [Puniceicoccaceae bacterium K14]|nr:lipopolysaccharide biosynthesis protein [Puniceicoccaceae bacterium K14]